MAIMSPTSIFFSVIVFMLLSNAITTQAGGSGSGKPKATSLIVEACKNASGETQDPDVTKEFCLSTLQSDKRSAEAKDLPGLVLVSIDILKGRVTDASVKLQYENVVSTLNICQAMIKDHQGDKGILHSLRLPHCVDIAGDTSDECQTDLEDVPGTEALQTDNERLRILFNLNTALVVPYDVRD
ncbi:unnamed protein product [Triticum turgidum subsp. durum]|uniref:Pectinesterase inhibitor domain-containing protein n=1 Tax=Triticum turgidum subsp. durum TaxID=4567 RepID=A0A9R0ZS62_TRITD|nr:unnamed protein product [Triticum turgidum subsp. durum]